MSFLVAVREWEYMLQYLAGACMLREPHNWARGQLSPSAEPPVHDDYAARRPMSRDVAENDDKRAQFAGPSGVKGLLKNRRLLLIALATAQGGLC
ncbi:hypothetical protein CspeluHIS016_0207360 [Cutaneotrichosporon spelunceum]|uniref:Uncharacterized protein n=1 Tax=Cutaneotrichosporon spelunceum TaxID=1672016 RepID=A0AAD3TRV1_9TREE|nr:hypothetical protein CspeluHIS016_0207360 [Cutaneotrichosporon spelunceum]